LFATPNPMVQKFRLRFEEFEEVDDNVIALYLEDAARIVIGAGFDLLDIELATLYLAAHLVKQRRDMVSSFSSSTQANTGAVKSIKVEDRMITYETASQTVTSRTGMSGTGYGMQYLSMLRRRQTTMFILRA
jgi:hypothetical protein